MASWTAADCVVLLLALSTLLVLVQGQSNCTLSCGSNSQCTDGSCSCNQGFGTPSGTDTDCISLTEPNPACTTYDPSCIYCETSLQQGPCLRCITSLFLDGEICVGFCSNGFLISAVPGAPGFIARTCMGSTPTVGGDTLPQWAIIVIAVVAVVIFAVIVVTILGFALSILTRSSHGEFDIVDEAPPSERGEGGSRGGTLRTKRSNSFSFETKGSLPMVQHNPNFSADIDGDEETVFFHKLDYLRTQAEVFLKMLNDMRRRLKEIPVDSAAAQQYRNVMQDCTRLLYMLNKRRSTLTVPPDGLQLLNWSEQILERYLTSQGVTLQRGVGGGEKTSRLSVLGPQDETNF